jgi:hypothetical protein
MFERRQPQYDLHCASPARSPHMAWWRIVLLAWLIAIALMIWFLCRSKRLQG